MPTKREEEQSTLSVRTDLADRVRQIAKNNGIPVVQVTNYILERALDSGEYEVATITVTFGPKKRQSREK